MGKDYLSMADNWYYCATFLCIYLYFTVLDIARGIMKLFANFTVDTGLFIFVMLFLCGLASLLAWDYYLRWYNQTTFSMYCRNLLTKNPYNYMMWLLIGSVTGFVVGLVMGFVLGHLFWN